MGDTCRECEECNSVKADVKEMLPTVREAKRLMRDYPQNVEKLEDELVDIKTNQRLEDVALRSILDRMDKHDVQEEIKRKERREDRKMNRNNFITIMFFLIGSIVSFGVWLNNANHKTDLRLQKIESHLDIKTKNKG